MATLEDAARIALGLPGVSEANRDGRRSWSVAGKALAWERPFSKADVRRFGSATPPAEPILAVSVESLELKEAILQSGFPGFFTIPHFDGYPAVLIQLSAASLDRLEEAIVDGWAACAPPELLVQQTAAETPDATDS